MRHTISSSMPAEIELMGAHFPLWWFCKVARRYVGIDGVMTNDERAHDVTDLVLEAIILGYEREKRRAEQGKPSLADRPVPYLKRTAANLVHEAARQSLRWHKRMSYSLDDFDRMLQEDFNDSNAKVDNNCIGGLYTMYPVEELIYWREKANNQPIASKPAKKKIK